MKSVLPLAVAACAMSALSTNAGAQTVTNDPILVTATRQPQKVSEALADVTVLDRTVLEQAGAATLPEVLARQPGLTVISNGSAGAVSQVFIRGASEKQTVVLIDGVRIGSVSKSAMESWSRIPLAQIDRVEIVRGPMSAIYGSDAVGGVIQIFTRTGEGAPAIYGEVGGGSNDTLSMNTGFSGQSGDWRYALGVSKFRTAGFSNVKPRAAAFNPDRDGFDNQSVTASLAYALREGQELGGSVFYSEGENLYDGGSGDYRTRLAVSSANAYWRARPLDNWTSTVRVGRTVDDSKNLKNGRMNSLYRTDQMQYLWQNDLRTHWGQWLLGAERLEQQLVSTSTYPVDTRNINSLLAGWQMVAGIHNAQINVRHDANSQFGDKTTGGMAYGLQFAEAWRLRAGYGTAFRAPSFNELYFTPSSSSFTSNPDLKPETARNREVALQFDQGMHHASLTWFFNQVENLIPSSGIMRNIGHAEIEGVNLAYEGQLGAYQVSANLGYLDPRDRDTGLILRRRSTRQGAVAIGRRVGPWEWRVEMEGNNRRFDDDANRDKMSGYALTHLYGAYHFNDGWSVFARANNIFDREYELAKDYATPVFNYFIGLRYTPR